jgi:hypothetical protein
MSAAKVKPIWQEHVRFISAAWQKGVESIVETGERLHQAKADPDMPRGSFEAMIQSKLPFGPRTAQRLMAIASNAVLSNPTHVSHLPPSWGTLAELAKLPTTLLLTKIEDGTINPKMERKDVRALKEPEQRDDDLPPDYQGLAEPEPDTPPPAEEPTSDDKPVTNPLIVLWATAGPEERREFVHACWDEIVRTHDQAGPAKPNGNAGADHWAHLSKENTEAIDRWIESDT